MHHTSHLVTYSFTRIHNKTLFNKVIPFLLPQTKCICLLCIRQTAVSTMCKMTYLHISKHSLTDLYSYRFIFWLYFLQTCKMYVILTRDAYYPVPDTWGDGVLFSIDFFVCLYLSVSLLARLRENGCSDSHEIFREGAEWPWDNLIQFLVNSEKPCNAAMLISLSATLRANRWTDLHEIFREGVKWPWDDLITLLVNSEKPCDAAMRNTGWGLLCFRTTACF